MTTEIPRSTEAFPIDERTTNFPQGNKLFGEKQESVQKFFLTNNAMFIHVSSQALSNHVENIYLANLRDKEATT